MKGIALLFPMVSPKFRNRRLFILTIGFSLFFAQAVYAEYTPDEFHEAVKLIYRHEIILPPQQKQIVFFIEHLDIAKENFSHVKDLSGVVYWKIQLDVDHLQNLLDNLQVMRMFRYAQSVGKLPKLGLGHCWDAYRDLAAQTAELYPVDRPYRVPPNIDDYEKIIYSGIALIAGVDFSDPTDTASRGGTHRGRPYPGITFYQVWQQIHALVKPVYSSWNARFHELQKRRPRTGQPFLEEPDPLTYEEKMFVDVFQKIQSELRRFAPVDSKDF